MSGESVTDTLKAPSLSWLLPAQRFYLIKSTQELLRDGGREREALTA